MKKSKGFTLIELMVVISIIGLLSSVVLVALKDVREKAKATKFRAEINQFINALELFRTDKGIYPNENEAQFFTYVTNGNFESSQPFGTLAPKLSTHLLPYIPALPKVPSNSFPSNFSALYYYVNSATSLTGTRYRCVGDTVIPKYIIGFNGTGNPTIAKIFSDLPNMEQSTLPPWDNWSLNNLRCFSLK